jgi:hypothetical protein
MALRLRYAIQMPKMATSKPPKLIAREIIVSEEGMIHPVVLQAVAFESGETQSG